MEYIPNNFGGNRTASETLKRKGWRKFGTFVVSASDPRLNPAERTIIRQLAERFYGDDDQGEGSPPSPQYIQESSIPSKPR